MYRSALHLNRASWPGWHTRLRRATGRDGNPLRRSADRAWVRLLAWAVILAPALAVSAVVATAAYHTDSHTAAVQATHRHVVSATTLAAAPPAPSASYNWPAERTVLAQWRYQAGPVHTGTISVPEGAPQGTVVSIWVNDTGQLTTPPRTTADIVFASIPRGLVTLAGLMPACWCAYTLYRRRRVAAALARDWERMEPLWSGRA
jgi:hypothetical protein